MNLFVESRGRGPDVVMLHGWGLHGGVFDRVASQLADRFCVHLVDLPGHGASAPWRALTLTPWPTWSMPNSPFRYKLSAGRWAG
jgi:pimeloyl-ACP methyl ester carboxylesterase